MSELHNAGRPSPGPASHARLTHRIGSTARTACVSDEPQATPGPKGVRRW
ncbi:hypothetical protein [Saccharopolyspora aridisoli]|nr:hypothetical protein [Saccharopolyspora aridisoli]